MAHKKMTGRRKAYGCSTAKPLQAARNEMRYTKKAVKAKREARKEKKLQDRAAAGEDIGAEAAAAAEARAAAQQAKEGRPTLTKKEQRQKSESERAHRSIYNATDRVLLVGEGNFSFARAMCRHLETGAGVYATCYDNEPTLNKKYTDAAEIRKDIEEKFNGTTLVGVDATKLHTVREFRKAFHKIVWNFPHMGAGESNVAKSVDDHRMMLGKFFLSAVRCMDSETGAIHVAIKAGEPYKSWMVVKTALAVCPELTLRTVLPFAPGAWEGYSHRRTAGFGEGVSRDDSEELAKGSSVYIFVKKSKK